MEYLYYCAVFTLIMSAFFAGRAIFFPSDTRELVLLDALIFSFRKPRLLCWIIAILLFCVSILVNSYLEASWYMAPFDFLLIYVAYFFMLIVYQVFVFIRRRKIK